jgi:excisionase family DNA binding protein
MRDPTVLTTSEVARRLHVTPSTVFRWIKAGWLRSLPTAGRHNRIREDDLVRFMKERCMQPADENGQLRVLVADSQPGMVDQIASLLRGTALGCAIETACDGYHALIKVGALAPQLVVLSANMPHMDTEGACNAIRASPQYRQTKIMVITGEAEAARRALLASGADAVLSRPPSPEQFLMELRRLLPGYLPQELVVPAVRR